MTQVNDIKFIMVLELEVIKTYDSIKKEFSKILSRFKAPGLFVHQGKNKFEILPVKIFCLKYKK